MGPALIHTLAHGTCRTAELRRQVGGISEKMLIQTLRRLERFGLVSRTAYPEVPPRVEYSLTALGLSLSEPIRALDHWVERDIDALNQAQVAYEENRRGGDMIGATLSAERWQNLWQRLGATPPEGSFAALTAHYSEPQRHYHNGAHINACLQHLDRFQHLAQGAAVVEFALWTHDAIYHTQRQDNEAASADLGEKWLREAGVPEHVDSVRRHILATAHLEPAEADDAGLVVDIDLSVLALPAHDYHAYTEAIRAEFAWVPEALFTAGRAKVLNTLLAMPYLYSHEEIRAHWEAKARANLQRELARLLA